MEFFEGFIIRTYIFKKKLGEGASSSVWEAKNAITNTNVAIKIISKRYLSTKKSLTQFQREIHLLKKMNHPLISELYEIFENDSSFFLVLEKADNGNLLEFVNSSGRFFEDKAKKFFIEIYSVINYLHTSCRVAHRDLKCENILLSSTRHVKVIDFGLSNTYNEILPYFKTACGSPAYVSPELVQGKEYTTSTDIWSLGVILFAIVAGYLPFDDGDVRRLLQKIVFTDVQFPSFFSEPLVDLLSRMLTKDPARRISLEQIREHPWFERDLYDTMTEYFVRNGLMNVFGEQENIEISEPEEVKQSHALAGSARDCRGKMYLSGTGENLYSSSTREKMDKMYSSSTAEKMYSSSTAEKMYSSSTAEKMYSSSTAEKMYSSGTGENQFMGIFDEEVINEIKELGFDVEPLIDSLKVFEFTELTSLYRILRRTKINKLVDQFFIQIYNPAFVASPATERKDLTKRHFSVCTDQMKKMQRFRSPQQPIALPPTIRSKTLIDKKNDRLRDVTPLSQSLGKKSLGPQKIMQIPSKMVKKSPF